MRKELSRECIRDTLLAKRTYGKRINRMIAPTRAVGTIH